MRFSLQAARRVLIASIAPACLALTACGQNQGPAVAPTGADGQATTTSGSIRRAHAPKRRASPIQHVVIIYQENESYDHLFAGTGVGDVSSTCKLHTGKTMPLTEQHLGASTATSHMATDFFVEYDGGNLDGWDLDPNSGPGKSQLGACTYVNPADIQPYTSIASQYVTADNYFTSHIDASFVAHQYIVAAQANHAVNLPTGDWGCYSPPSQNDLIPTLNADRTIGPYESPCFTYTTLADELDAAGLTWHFYAPSLASNYGGGTWSSFLANSQIYNGPDWSKNVINPETQVLTDIQNGTLQNVTWVIPDYCNSDHPGALGSSSCSGVGIHGPDWVASIVNAIGESPFWNNTMIFVTWDEWGGEFDHVKPPYMDYDGDGFRVPLLCISPYAYSNTVNHTQLETGGILRYVEDTFGLSTLAAADARATPADSGCTNPSQTKPRTFSPIAASLGARHFIRQRHSGVPPDDQ